MQWYKDLILAGKHEGTGNYFVTLGSPWHVSTTGDNAYVVVPATMTFTVHGKKVKQRVQLLRGAAQPFRTMAYIGMGMG